MVGLGPGFPEHLTARAREALASAQTVLGYRTYIDLVRPLLAHAEIIATGMMDEVGRSQAAIQRAQLGQRVALVSSGDAGIYGMAGLVLEMASAQGLRPGPLGTLEEVDFFFEVVPGVPALAASAALLGAPLMHDFAVISLSDLLTPWELIVQRLRLAAQADLVLVLYNPKSKRRDWQLGEVQNLLVTLREPDTPVGIVQRAMREGQDVVITSLNHLLEHPVDMQTLVIVGNSQTIVYGSYMITPRGYQDKYRLSVSSER